MQEKRGLPLKSGEAIVAPGVFDALSALIAQRAGAKACYLSGASLSYTQIARPDLGFIDLNRIVDATARISDRINIPLIVDADTGFGNALNVQYTVRALERAGASVIQIEDQMIPKRCGHLAGKKIVTPTEMIGKINAAVDARYNSETLIIARTDSVSVEGLDAAFERAERYIEAGADILFIEALRNEVELKEAGKKFAHRIPLLANMVEGGRTPIKAASVLAQFGYQLVICPGALARAFAHMASDFLTVLLQDGSAEAYADRMLNFDQINEIVGLTELTEIGEIYSGTPKKAAE